MERVQRNLAASAEASAEIERLKKLLSEKEAELRLERASVTRRLSKQAAGYEMQIAQARAEAKQAKDDLQAATDLTATTTT